jgi:quinol monooxygenase YgiN
MTPKQKKKTPSKAKAASVKPKPSPAASRAPKAQGNLSVLVWLHARKGKQVPLERELRALIGPTRAEPGCLVYTLHHSADRPLDFFLHEVWASEADLARHWQMPHFKSWVGRQSAVLESRQRFVAD